MIESPSGLDIAALHGTILSIIVGVFAAYALSAFSQLEEHVLRVQRAAEQINRRFPWPPPLRLGGTHPPPQGRDGEPPPEPLVRLRWYAMGTSNAADDAETGATLIRIIEDVTTRYPFPTRTSGSEVTVPIVLNSLEDVERWVTEMERLSGNVQWLSDEFGQPGGRLHRVLFAFDERETLRRANLLAEMSEVDQARLASKVGRLRAHFNGTATETWAWLVQTAQVGRELVEETRRAQDELSSVSRNIPGRSFFLAASIFAGIAFAAGVIAPLVFTEVPALVWKAVPLVFYVVSFVVVLVVIWRRYPTAIRSKAREAPSTPLDA